MIQPTVGRVVWFNGDKTRPDLFPGCESTRAAIVAHVHNDRMVNLCVVDGDGNPHSFKGVPLVQEGDSIPSDGHHCCWMPYQLGQSKAAGKPAT